MSRQARVEDDDEDMGISLADLPTDQNYTLNTSAAGIAPEKASAIYSQFDRKKRAAALAVPTDDGRVRSRLRELGEPMTLFGEDAADRRERLRLVMLDNADAGEDEDTSMGDADDANDQEEEFYREGAPELLAARQDIARFSLPRAKTRIASQKVESGISMRTHGKHRKAIKDRLGMYELVGSQIAGERHIGIARFSPDGKTIAAGNWAGGIRILEVPTLNETRSLRGHSDRIGGIAWRPGATIPGSGVSEDQVNLASGAENGTIHLWSQTQDTPIASLNGHSGRVCRVEFHPSGRYLASASFDTTWRLWDIETTTELLIQEGHSREVYAVSFNTDGSLCASAGLDSIGRVWDIRTGRTTMVLQGHIREIYALDWGTDGYRLLSGSGDGFVKCWDLRNVKQVGQIGAHRNLVSDVRWFKGLDNLDIQPTIDKQDNELKPRKSGTFFVSGGFDKKVNIFSADDWALCKSLSGHSSNVLSVDISHDSKWIASSGADRTVKLWGCDDGLGIDS